MHQTTIFGLNEHAFQQAGYQLNHRVIFLDRHFYSIPENGSFLQNDVYTKLFTPPVRLDFAEIVEVFPAALTHRGVYLASRQLTLASLPSSLPLHFVFKR